MGILENRKLVVTPHKNFAELLASMYRVWATQYEVLVCKTSHLTAAAWSRSSPLTAVTLHRASVKILNTTTHHF
jgi:hypothetical protein